MAEKNINEHTAQLAVELSWFKRSIRPVLSRQLLTFGSEVALAWMKPFDLHSPRTKPPYEGRELRVTGLWQPYPRPEPEVTYFPLISQQQRFELYTIAVELLPLVLSGNPTDSPMPGIVVLDTNAKLDRLREAEEKFTGWYQHLPVEMDLDMSMSTPLAGPVVDLR